MSRSCQSGDVLETDDSRGAHDAREAADALGDLWVALVRHRRRALHPLPNGSSTSRTSVRARWRISGAKRSSDVAAQCERREQLGMPVACDHLRRERVRLQAEPLARDALDLGVELRVRADGAGELPDAVLLERRASASARGRARRPSRRASSRRWSARRGSRASGRCRRCGGAPRPAARRRASARSMPSSTRWPASLDLQRERRVDDVGGREPVVDPATFRPELLGDGVDEGGDVVVGRLLDLGDTFGCRSGGTRADRCDVLGGDRADSAQPSSAASSTSSQRAQLVSSDQILPISGRE